MLPGDIVTEDQEHRLYHDDGTSHMRTVDDLTDVVGERRFVRLHPLHSQIDRARCQRGYLLPPPQKIVDDQLLGRDSVPECTVVEMGTDGERRRCTFLVVVTDTELVMWLFCDRSLDDLSDVYTPFLDVTWVCRGQVILIVRVYPAGIVLVVGGPGILFLEGGLVDSWTWNFLVGRNTSHLQTEIAGTWVSGTLIEEGFEMFLVGRWVPFQGPVGLELRIVVLCVPFRQLSVLVGVRQGCSCVYRIWEGALISRGLVMRDFPETEEFDFVDLF